MGLLDGVSKRAMKHENRGFIIDKWDEVHLSTFDVVCSINE